MNQLLLVAIIRLLAVDAPVPGFDPMSPLLKATLNAQVLQLLSHQVSNKAHSVDLQRISKEITGQVQAVH